MKSENQIFVVGGASVDIQACANEAIRANDSNPGKYAVSCGGVGRNVAVNLSLLKMDVKMMCIVGNDSGGKNIISDFEKHGIDTSLISIAKDEDTASYISLHEPNGEMYAAVSSMEINNRLTPEIVSAKIEEINQSSACFIETNVSADVIRFVAENCKVKLFLDTVSEHKTRRAADCTGRFYCIKPNRQEAEILCGFVIKSKYDLLKAADFFHGKGVSNVFISMGKDGVFFSDAKQNGIPEFCDVNVKNVTGAGDAFIAAVIYADLSGASIDDQALYGTAASVIALGSEESVSSNISVENILDVMKNKNMNLKRI